MQDKSKKNESAKKVQTKDNAHNLEMKEALNIQINETMNFTPAEQLVLVEFINAMSETREPKELSSCVEQMVRYLEGKPPNFQFDIQKKLERIYILIENESVDADRIETLIEETGLSSDNPEILRVRTMLEFLED
ncbi:hypothetical protein WAF17_02780 [Bernardetia sp. ABR2-2B]|uniref:hypothetical protein n=1 Tax=Bernardetia sp. ABR2-2B TaxID=3127472 RepID=UPI0030D212AF